MRAYRRPIRLVIPIVVVTAALAGDPAWLGTPRAAADVVVFDSNGFETPTFTAGNMTGQQGFQALPGSGAGTVQTGTTMSGSQALQINGSALLPNAAYGDANFWYKSYSVASAVKPVPSGNPVVKVNFNGRVSGALALPSDIPFGGPYLEGYTTSGNPLDQQAITPILLNTNGGISVFSNFTVGGSDGIISSANGLLARETWYTLSAQLNFSSQSFEVLLNGSPVTFTEGAFSGIDVPFRNTNGPTFSIAELGFQGYYNSSFQPTFNNMYFDNFSVVATPVPEPSTLVLGGLGLIGLAARLRKRK